MYTFIHNTDTRRRVPSEPSVDQSVTLLGGSFTVDVEIEGEASCVFSERPTASTARRVAPLTLRFRNCNCNCDLDCNCDRHCDCGRSCYEFLESRNAARPSLLRRCVAPSALKNIVSHFFSLYRCQKSGFKKWRA